MTPKISHIKIYGTVQATDHNGIGHIYVYVKITLIHRCDTTKTLTFKCIFLNTDKPKRTGYKTLKYAFLIFVLDGDN